LTAKAEEIGRIKQQVIGNPEEGSIYIVYYSVEGPRWAPFGGEFSSDLAATNASLPYLVEGWITNCGGADKLTQMGNGSRIGTHWVRRREGRSVHQPWH
jgi:hypothetical protein